jgi:hypothetical protein
MPRKAGTSTVGTPEGAGNSEEHQNEAKSEVDSSGKHRNTGRSRNFRNTGSSTQAEDTREPRHLEEEESMTDARSEDWNRYPLQGFQDAKPGAGSSCGECRQGEEPRGTRAEEPKCPKSLKLSLRGSVERQAQRRQDRLGEPWSRSV